MSNKTLFSKCTYSRCTEQYINDYIYIYIYIFIYIYIYILRKCVTALKNEWYTKSRYSRTLR